MSHTIRMRGPLMWIELSGTLTRDEYAAVVEESDRLADELGRTPDRIVDTTRLEISELVFESFLAARHRRARRPPLNSYRIAIVVVSEARFGGARMFQQATEDADRRIEIFDSIERALVWLGVDAELGEVE